MPLSMYTVSVPVMIHGFGVLSFYIDKAEAYARELGIDPSVLVNARLAPDMMTFAGQIQRASDNAKGGVARLAAIPAPGFADNETTFDELRARIDKTVDFLKTVKPEQLEGSEDRIIDLKFGGAAVSFPGQTYLFSMLIPNFFFHITTAHDILRHNGVKIGKRDYFGKIG
jgi:uncharacterized protein